MNNIQKHLRRTVLAGVILLAGASSAYAVRLAPVGEYSANLSASPTSFNGDCPAVIEFKGTITASKPGRVQYKFIRSDNAIAPIQTLEFAAAGTQTVSTTWTLGGEALPSYHGWEAIEIVSPATVKSNEAKFELACKNVKSAHATVPVKPALPGKFGVAKTGPACASSAPDIAITDMTFSSIPNGVAIKVTVKNVGKNQPSNAVQSVSIYNASLTTPLARFPVEALAAGQQKVLDMTRTVSNVTGEFKAIYTPEPDSAAALNCYTGNDTLTRSRQ